MQWARLSKSCFATIFLTFAAVAMVTITLDGRTHAHHGTHMKPHPPKNGGGSDYFPEPKATPSPDAPGDTIPPQGTKLHEFVFRGGGAAKDLDIANATSFVLGGPETRCGALDVTLSGDGCRYTHTIHGVDASCALTRVVCDAMPDELETSDFTIPALTDTDYRYLVMCPSSSPIRCYTSEMLRVPTSRSCPGRNHTPWAIHHTTKHNSTPDYLTQKDDTSNFTTDACLVIGVNMTVTTAISINITDAERKAFSLNEFRYFTAHVMIFGAFDVDEYRVVVDPLGHIQSEDEIGLLYPPTEIRHQLYWWGEKQSHEIAHAFVGGHIRFLNFTASAGLGEGLTHLLGLMGTHPMMWLQESASDVKYYGDVLIGQKKDLPLNVMSIYANTSMGNSYYIKGSLMYNILALHMNAIQPSAFCRFLRWLLKPENRINITTGVMAKGVAEVLMGQSSSFDAADFFVKYYNESDVFPQVDLDKVVGSLALLRTCPAFV